MFVPNWYVFVNEKFRENDTYRIKCNVPYRFFVKGYKLIDFDVQHVDSSINLKKS